MTRLYLPSLLTKHSMIAEVGVAAGRFTRLYLPSLPDAIEIHLIDHWDSAKAAAIYPPEMLAYVQAQGGMCGRGTPEEQYTQIADMAEKDARLHIHRHASEDVVGIFPDEYFDWVYLDADTTYEGTKKAIADWFPKVAVGGILSGHDFDPDPAHPQFAFMKAMNPLFDVRQVYDVARAVRDTFRGRFSLTDEPFWKSWYVRK